MQIEENFRDHKSPVFGLGLRASQLHSAPRLLAPVLQIIHRVINTFLIKQAHVKRKEANTGAIERCVCGGNLKIIAVIEEPAVIERLTHLGLAVQPPPRATARRVDLFWGD